MMDNTTFIVLIWIIGAIISMVLIYHYDRKLTVGGVFLSCICWFAVVVAAFGLCGAWLFSEASKIVILEKKEKVCDTVSWYDKVSKKDDKFNKIINKK